jgi:D-beta-D-heptose 7-phosphate kinase/D-beta-D-heptose 1-phosphate adenosyltransferase
VAFAAAVGADAFAHYVTDLLADEDIGDEGIVTVSNRPTTRKTRVVAHNQQVVRVDWESVADLPADDRTKLRDIIKLEAARADAVVLSDYAKGLFSRDLVEAAMGCPIVVADPKPENFDFFSGVTCVAPNVHEAERATDITIDNDTSLRRAGEALLRRLGCRYVIITRGEHGMSLFGRDGERLHAPSVARAVYDVSGAGDTASAMLSLALGSGINIESAMQLANFAAAAVVEKLGTATATCGEIVALVQHGASNGPIGKVHVSTK